MRLFLSLLVLSLCSCGQQVQPSAIQPSPIVQVQKAPVIKSCVAARKDSIAAPVIKPAPIAVKPKPVAAKSHHFPWGISALILFGIAIPWELPFLGTVAGAVCGLAVRFWNTLF